jgi:hypothetical protein
MRELGVVFGEDYRRISEKINAGREALFSSSFVAENIGLSKLTSHINL